MKSWKDGEWVQIKGAKSDPSVSTSPVRKQFKHDANYGTVLADLKSEFHKNTDVVNKYVLVSMFNQIVQNVSDFSIYSYVQSHKKYIGATRLYLGLIAMDTPKESAIATETPHNPTTSTQSSVTSSSAKMAHQDATDNDSPPESTVQAPVASSNLTSTVSGNLTSLLDPKSTVQDSSDDFETVVEFIKQEKMEADATHEEKDTGDLRNVDTSLFCPVYASNVKLQIFLSAKGKQYQTVSSGWGDFVCLPHEDMKELDIFKKSFDSSELFLVTPALLYFVKYEMVSADGQIHVESYADNVWKLPPGEGEKFNTWKQNIIDMNK